MTLRQTHLLFTVATSPSMLADTQFCTETQVNCDWYKENLKIPYQDWSTSGQMSLMGGLLESFLESFPQLLKRAPREDSSSSPTRSVTSEWNTWKRWGQLEAMLESSLGTKTCPREHMQRTKESVPNKTEEPLLCHACPFSGHPGTFDINIFCFKSVELG